MSETEFVSKVLEAFSKIKGETDEKGGEFDFRYRLAVYLFRDVLGWSREAGKGHFNFEDDRKDLLFYDDSDPPLPVLIVETVNPKEESASHIGKLEGYLMEMGCVRYGILTNGHDLSVYEYVSKSEPKEAEVGEAEVRKYRRKRGKDLDLFVTLEPKPVKKLPIKAHGKEQEWKSKHKREGMNKLWSEPLNIDQIVQKGVDNLTKEERGKIFQLRNFARERFVKFDDIKYFKTHTNDIPLNRKFGYGLFINGLRESLKELTRVFAQFFEIYEKRSHVSGEKLRKAFENWKKTRVGGEAEPKETFCKETAYILLDRILFARICEDKEFMQKRLSGKYLGDFIERHKGLEMPYLKALEDAFDFAEVNYKRKYLVVLFDWWKMERAEGYTLGENEKREQGNLEKEFDYVIGGVLKKFNHFDFKTVDSDILGHVYEDYLSKEERKKLGEYYTPPEVVRYILDAVGYTSAEEIKGKKILDPSCGSGTFLVEAVRRLIKSLSKKPYKSSVARPEPDEASMILESVRNCIYGLDINIFACHITEMNLFFQTIDLYGAVKSKYKEEVFSGFNVFQTDSLMPPKPKSEDFSEWGKSDSNNAKGIAGIKRMKFDFVVGNPPYVRVQRLDKEQKEQYGKYYRTPKANYDIYIIFIERGAKWLENSGKLGFITPDQYTLTNYGEKLRKFIAEKYKIEQFIDFADTGVFRDVSNYPSIIIIKKTDNEKEINSNFVKCVRVKQPKDDLLKDIQRRIYKREYFNEYYDLFEFSQANLADVWNFMPEEEKRVFEKIEDKSDCKFKEISERIFQGLVSGADAIYLIKVTEEINDNLVKIKPIKSEREYIIEKEMLKPLLKGKDVRRWSIDWKDLRVIFPYKIVSGDAILYSEDEMGRDFLKTWQYFLDHEKELKGRERGKWKSRKDWYAFGRKQNLHRFEQKKILVQVLANRSSFTLDEDGLYYFMGGSTAGAYGILLNDEYNTAEDYLYFLGLLNSSVLEFYIKHISQLFSGGYYAYGRQYLEKLPIKLPQTSEEEDIACEIISMVERIFKQHKELSELENKTSEFPDSYISEERHPLLEVWESRDLSRKSYSPSRLRIKVEDIEGRMIYKAALTKKDYIAFKTESSAKFLFEVLKRKGRIIKNDLFRMYVPSDADAEEIMKEYEEDLEKIESLKREIEVLDKGTDEQVYELYGLDEEDRKVIEEFLEK
jgi:type I restriction-modification system DNA methylase subunit